MNITTPHYPGFDDTTLESLLLSLARKILEIQKSPSTNLTNDTIITVVEDLNSETTTITLVDIQASVIDGIIVIKNYFNYNFTSGVGSYPYNRTNLVDAFFHVLMFQQKQELIIAKNSGSKMCCDFDVTNVNEMNMSQQLIINCSLTDYPITVANNGDSLTTVSKQYLL
jgi:hypothetical protein